MKKLTDFKFLLECFRQSIPPEPEESVCEWGRKYIRLPGSARSENYNPDITPWAKRPTECTNDGKTSIISFCKPIQSGGSVASEIAACFRIARKILGDIQWNWESDEKALDRWDKRIERILKACLLVRALWPAREEFKAKKCLVAFGHCNLIVQGQHTSDNLDSDSVAFQINEELHNWEPGRLEKADGRLTAVWNAIQMNVSNASFFEDQFHQRWQSGTQEFWEVPCPECGKFWPMWTRWDERRPELGGLRYDADGCRLGNGKYDYNKLVGTIRYQFPCKHTIRDNREVRRQMSAKGRYGKPTNPGAAASNVSCTLEAVAVDYIPWLKLIQQKHSALLAMRLGDPEPWWQYLRERECKFVDKNEDRPPVGIVIVNTKLKKNRDGLSNRVARLAGVDRQQGSARRNELAHWWLVIRDVDADGNSLLVWEGKCLTDEDLVQTIKGHGVRPCCVAVDSGDDTTHVCQMCLRHGWDAVKGAGQPNFAHEDGSRRIYSTERPLHKDMHMPPSCENPDDEPRFWLYSKHGIYERLHWLRSSQEIKWEVPGDISEAYRKHIEAVQYSVRKHPRTGEQIGEFVFASERFDLAYCEALIAVNMERAGLIGSTHAPTPTKTEVKEYQLK